MLIDNEPIMGCTGGVGGEFKPGPIYLQGDHTGINYRNIVLTLIVIVRPDEREQYPPSRNLAIPGDYDSSGVA
jgi:hypothetical protein